MSLDILIEKIVEKQNPTVVGLDPNRITSYNVCYTKLLRS